MLYVDGCSYMAGHDFESNNNPIYRRLGFASNEVDNKSYVCKSNESILNSFLSKYHNLKEDDTVLIMWTHSERRIDGPIISENSVIIHDTKNINSRQFPHIDNQYKYFFGRIIATLNYMYTVYLLCKQKNIKCRFVTIDNYNFFKLIFDNIQGLKSFEELYDNNVVFNWPSPKFEDIKIENAFNPDTYKKWLCIWSLSDLPLTWAYTFGSIQNENYLSPDQKHIDIKGYELFAQQLVEFIDDSSKNLDYILQDIAYEHKKYFYGLKSYTNLNFKSAGKHWVEDIVEEVLHSLAKSNADYIYER